MVCVLQVNVKEVINLDRKKSRCYAGNDFDTYILTVVKKRMMRKFGCTVPMMPRHARQNSKICTNLTAAQQALQYFR